MTMDWTFPPDGAESGLFEIGRRLAEHIGRLPDATRFTYDPRDMLRVTREIEAAARGGNLWVGFQLAAKLEHERDRYRDLVAAGTQVRAYAVGMIPSGLEGLDYREQAADTRRLANQWFLVSDRPEPVAFVSWELAEPDMFGIGGATTPGKRFVGFVSDDPLVVAELVASLDRTRGQAPKVPAPPAAPGGDVAADDLKAAVNRLDPAPSAAPDGAVVVPVGRGDPEALALALALARKEGRRLVLVDRGAEGVFGSPYGDLRGDDANRPDPARLFGSDIARREGRMEAARGLDVAGTLGVEAGGWFPTTTGDGGLSEAIRRFGGALLVLPASVLKPTFVERLRGMSADRLAGLGATVIIAD